MSNKPVPTRLYGEKEVGKILKRATELQRDRPAGGAGSGLSLQELEEIAAEAGIDPRHLRDAAMELESGDLGVTGLAKLVGDQLTLVREAVVPGELPDEGFEGVVGVIQGASHEHGQPSLLGRTLTWQAETPTKTRSIQLVVSVRKGETRVRIEERLHQMVGVVFGSSMGGVGAGVGLGVGIPLSQVLGSVLLGVAFPVGTLAVTYIAGRWIYRAVVDGRRKAVDALMDAVVEEVRERIEEGSDPREAPSLPRPS